MSINKILISLLLLMVSVTCLALPRGSYLATCSGCSIFNNQLACVCKTKDGFPNRTTLGDPYRCSSVKNVNGSLTCLQRHHYRPMPTGSYRNTCRRCSVDRGMLSCQCKTQMQLWTWTRIKYRSCRGGIKNNNGHLSCWQSHRDRLPPGSYKRSCKQCNYNGYRLSCSCRDRRGVFRYSGINRAGSCSYIRNINGMLLCR